MAVLVSAKGSDILAWRACGDFATSYRQSLLAKLEFCRSNQADELLQGTEQAIDKLVADNDAFCQCCRDLIEEVSGCTEPLRLKAVTGDFYTRLYDHFEIFRSAAAFYELSSRFIQALSGSISRYACMTLDPQGRQMPKVMLVALGSAGRQEFSPFCTLQFMLVHDEVDEAGREDISLLGRLIHESFEACGLKVDAHVTPLNPEWRGSIPEWRQRLLQRLEQGRVNQLVDLVRLSDQFILCRDEGFDPGFNEICRSVLIEHRSFLAFQVSHVLNLSHGLGIMGGLRMEKKGPCRGLFALDDNALQPFSAAICVIALIKGLDAPSAPQRIREILWRRELNVDMAERLLQAWQALHELRLVRERVLHPDWSDGASKYLDIGGLQEGEQIQLRESLETIGAIQRHVGLTFSGMEG